MNKLENLTDTELMNWYHLAKEMRDLKYLRAIKAEITRRNKDE